MPDSLDTLLQVLRRERLVRVGSCRHLQIENRPDVVDPVGLLPGEESDLSSFGSGELDGLGVPSEMTVHGGGSKDRIVELQLLDDGLGRKSKTSQRASSIISSGTTPVPKLST